MTNMLSMGPEALNGSNNIGTSANNKRASKHNLYRIQESNLQRILLYFSIFLYNNEMDSKMHSEMHSDMNSDMLSTLLYTL